MGASKETRDKADALKKKRATAEVKKPARKPQPKNKSHTVTALLKKAGNKKWDDTFIHPEDAAGNIGQYFSTGLAPLDVLLTGEVGKGIPAGRMTELLGQSDVGKTTLGCYLIKSAQEAGGVGILIDTESSLSAKRMSELGVDLDGAIVIEEVVIEEILEQIEFLVEKLGDTPAVIFWDTIASTRSRSDAGKRVSEGRIARHATAMSDGLRRITKAVARSNVALVCCNQRKEGGIGEMFTNARQKDATLGGEAIRFHTTHRIKLSYLKKRAPKEGEAAFVVHAQCLKNKVAPSNLVCSLVFNNQGDVAEWDKPGCIISTLQKWKALREGAHVYTTRAGAKLTQNKLRAQLMASKEFGNEMNELLETTFNDLTNRNLM